MGTENTQPREQYTPEITGLRPHIKVAQVVSKSFAGFDYSNFHICFHWFEGDKRVCHEHLYCHCWLGSWITEKRYTEMEPSPPLGFISSQGLGLGTELQFHPAWAPFHFHGNTHPPHNYSISQLSSNSSYCPWHNCWSLKQSQQPHRRPPPPPLLPPALSSSLSTLFCRWCSQQNFWAAFTR